jgi:hypothetical protein
MPVQSTYAANIAAAFLGQRANMENWNAVSLLVEDAAGIAFGVLVVQGTGTDKIKAATAEGVAVGTPVVTGAANGAVGTWTVDAGAVPGNYLIRITGTGATAAYDVEKPDGTLDGTGNVGTAYNGTINGTLADGSTDWAPGMYVTVPVTQSGGGNIRGITLRDETLAPANPDTYPQKSTAAVMTSGTIWVTAGATVAQGDPVYYIPATKKFTNVIGTTNVPVPTAMFDSAGSDAGLVKLRLSSAGAGVLRAASLTP